MGACLVIIAMDDVGGMASTSASALHPLVDSTLPAEAAAFGRHSRGTKDCIEKGDKSLDCEIMWGAVA